jgi:hypothetical protein
VPCDVVVVPRLKPAGQVSLRVTPEARDGPEFLTVIVYVPPPRSVTLVRPSVLVTDKSALVMIVVVSLALLFPVTLSGVVLVTLAVLVCVPAGAVEGTV